MRKIITKYPEVMKEIRTYLLELPKPRSKNTIKSYQLTIERMLNYLKKTPKTITYKDIYKWKDWIQTRTTQRKKTHYRNSYANLYCAINTFCKIYDIKDRRGQILRIIPPERIKPEFKRTFLDKDEVERLFEASRDDIRNYPLFRVFIEAGTRVSELIHLNIDDVNTIDVNGNTHYYLQIGNRDFTPKANSFRKSFITKETYDAIQRYIKSRTPKEDIPNFDEKLAHWEQKKRQATEDDHYNHIKTASTMIWILKKQQEQINDSKKALFHNIHNNRLGLTDIRNTISRYAIKCKITKRLTPHVFRHTCINQMKAKGKSPDQIKLQSGHSSTKALDIYGNLDIIQQAEVFDDVFVKTELKPVIEPVAKPEQQVVQTVKEDKDIETLLIERLAKGEINSEAFGLAMLKLKKREKPNIDYYQ